MLTESRLSAVHQLTDPLVPKLAKKLGRKRAKPVAVEPQKEDPIAELRRLVGEHKRLAKTIQRWGSDIKARVKEDGTVIPPVVTGDMARADVERAIKTLKADQAALVKAMTAQMKGVPIFDEFLSNVYSVGDGVLAAYIIAMVRIEHCPNVSNLIRYCGNAVDPNTGRLERRNSAPKSLGGNGTFNDDIRRVLYLIMTTMRKNSARSTATKPNGTTTKYLDRWYNASYSRRTTGRDKGADKAGRMKATDLFLWDLYVMWRTLEGLDIRPDKYSAIRGRWHNGQECHDSRYTLTIEEAREVVGEVRGVAAESKRSWGAVQEEESE